MGIEPTRSLFPNPSPVLKTGPGTSRGHTPVCCPTRAGDENTKASASVLPAILPVSSPKSGERAMGRHAKLRRKGEYRATDAGGKTTYFGKTNNVPYRDALRRFRKFPAGRSAAEPHLRCYHATGARTSELLTARVADFQTRSRQIVLGSHKRSETLKVPIPRAIALNDEAFAISQRRCEGRAGGEPIFTQPRNGRPWDRHAVAERFRAIRERAKVRDSITIYSFRHFWISEMLMAGVDVLLVARVAGTSVAMIERVYGHFRNQSYQEAQARLDRERAARGL